MKMSPFFLLTNLLCAALISFSLCANELIDVVYTWVDGSDPQWQALLKEYALREGDSIAAGGCAKKRFANHDELRYSLRSIFQYAPWVNHVFIVTFGHKPKWLKDHPMISVVDHREIFRDPSVLPTFNSMAIECNLHRIPGLQEHYLYFNDDVFLGAPVTPQDFFTPEDKMKIFLSKRKLPTGLPMAGEEGFFAASKNTGTFLDRWFGPAVRYMHAHTPYPILKSFVSSLETQYPDIFATVSAHRFRSLEDYTITNGLIPYAALYTEHGEQATVSWTTINFGADPSHDIRMCRKILKDRPQFFCVQDALDGDLPLSLSLLDSFFMEYFPEPAPWEKDKKILESEPPEPTRTPTDQID